MDESAILRVACLTTEAGLRGEPETTIVADFCGRMLEAGVPLARAAVFIDTLHPVHEGRGFRWQRGGGETSSLEYGSSTVPDVSDRWLRSPFYLMLRTGEAALRRRIPADPEEAGAEFSILSELSADGLTDYLATISRFGPDGVIGDMDGVYASWASDDPSGFRDEDVALLRRLEPFLSMAVKSATLGRVASTLVETYLGRDAGRRVLKGQIARGRADRIEAVLWFSDLRGFTRITDTADPNHVIPLLNDYADAVVSAVHEAGGDVLKFIGDGVLAIFAGEDHCAAALAAADAVGAGVRLLNGRRAAEAVPVTDVYLGLHVGEVFYGNVGSRDRLDFTVIGPAVNEVSRIAAMCRSADQPVLISSAFAGAIAPAHRERLVSVGRYALRGVGRPQELFTLDRSEGPTT